MYILLILTTIQLINNTTVLQVYADQPCPQWDLSPQPQYMFWPWITPDNSHLTHSAQDYLKIIVVEIIVNKLNITLYHVESCYLLHIQHDVHLLNVIDNHFKFSY